MIPFTLTRRTSFDAAGPSAALSLTRSVPAHTSVTPVTVTSAIVVSLPASGPVEVGRTVPAGIGVATSGEVSGESSLPKTMM